MMASRKSQQILRQDRTFFHVESSVSLRNPAGIEGGMFYGPQRKIKLEMEEFGDLSPFVSQKKTYSSSIDELNTPIYDKDADAFDFGISNLQSSVQADFHVMLKCDAFYRENNFTPLGGSHHDHEDIFLNSENTHRIATTTTINNNQQQHSDATIYSPPASDHGTYIEKMSPNSTTLFDFDMNGSVSVSHNNNNNSNCNSRHSSYPPSPSGYMPTVMDTPDGSEKSYVSSPASSVKPRLSLDLGLMPNAIAPVLDINTPGIIAEVVSLESTGFNILDLVNEDDNHEVFPFDTNVIPTQSCDSKVSLNFKAAQKQPRKRRRVDDDDDDDEDYVPPTKINCRYSTTTTNSRSSVQDYSEDSDSDLEEKPLVTKKARGRPPKRTQSVSSDCSKESNDVSKYRELRDKNNEASRKSRLKRKMKELELETEADELHNKNIKLKAQVEELEKMVTNFRDNLFKIMINK